MKTENDVVEINIQNKAFRMLHL